MIILAIETSCDETAIAILKIENYKLEIKSNIVSSQIKIHKQWGGVVPTLAKREHQKTLTPVLKKALKKAGLLNRIENSEYVMQDRIQNLKLQKLKEILIREENLYNKLKKFLLDHQKPEIDAIAVTVGPGLEPALWVGVNFAKALGYYWRLPIIPVNHIEAHILSNIISNQQSAINNFPAICLIVSGGHTQLILIQNIGKYRLLGETRDDAAGECFDKVARILSLGYPGGPAIAAYAAMEARRTKYEKTRRERSSGLRTSDIKLQLPRPMINQKNYDFSFSGLKTAALYLVKQLTDNPEKKSKISNGANKRQLTIKQKREICFEVQQAIIDVLIKKTLKAAKDYRVKTILLGGGVAANQELRRQFKEKIKKEMPDTKYLIPDIKFCTDNAAMIAITAYFCRNQKKNWLEVKTNANLRI